MSHASHQAHEQARRDKRHADVQDKPESKINSRPTSKKHGVNSALDPAIKGSAPAAPPQHEDEAFRVFDGSSPQSDG